MKKNRKYLCQPVKNCPIISIRRTPGDLSPNTVGVGVSRSPCCSTCRWVLEGYSSPVPSVVPPGTLLVGSESFTRVELVPVLIRRGRGIEKPIFARAALCTMRPNVGRERGANATQMQQVKKKMDSEGRLPGAYLIALDCMWMTFPITHHHDFGSAPLPLPCHVLLVACLSPNCAGYSRLVELRSYRTAASQLCLRAVPPAFFFSLSDYGN